MLAAKSLSKGVEAHLWDVTEGLIAGVEAKLDEEDTKGGAAGGGDAAAASGAGAREGKADA